VESKYFWLSCRGLVAISSLFGRDFAAVAIICAAILGNCSKSISDRCLHQGDLGNYTKNPCHRFPAVVASAEKDPSLPGTTFAMDGFAMDGFAMDGFDIPDW